MKRNILLVIVLVRSLISPVFGSTDTGNPLDVKKPELSGAWFLNQLKEENPREVKYCILSAPNFGPSTELLQQKIEVAVDSWRKYIHERRIFERNTPKAKLKPAVEFRRISNCNGSEDLKFLFGVSEPSVEAHRSHFHNPIAFAQRTDEDYFSTWGKGL